VSSSRLAHIRQACTQRFYVYIRQTCGANSGYGQRTESDASIIKTAVYIGLHITIYIQYIYGIFGRKSPNIRSYTVYRYKQFWPTLGILVFFFQTLDTDARCIHTRRTKATQQARKNESITFVNRITFASHQNHIHIQHCRAYSHGAYHHSRRS